MHWGPTDAQVPEPQSRSWRRDKTVAVDWQQRSLASLTRELGHQAVHVVKIDIEGAEWDVLQDVAKHAQQLLVEVHFGKRGGGRRQSALRALSEQYALFSTVRNHNARGNRPDSLRFACFELSFLRRDALATLDWSIPRCDPITISFYGHAYRQCVRPRCMR